MSGIIRERRDFAVKPEGCFASRNPTLMYQCASVHAVSVEANPKNMVTAHYGGLRLVTKGARNILFITVYNAQIRRKT